MHKSLHTENVRNISQSVPGESDGFHANPKYCAVPISGSAGVIAIIRVNFLFIYSFCLIFSSIQDVAENTMLAGNLQKLYFKKFQSL